MRIGIGSSRGGAAPYRPVKMPGHPGTPRAEFATPPMNEALT